MRLPYNRSAVTNKLQGKRSSCRQNVASAFVVVARVPFDYAHGRLSRANGWAEHSAARLCPRQLC